MEPMYSGTFELYGWTCEADIWWVDGTGPSLLSQQQLKPKVATVFKRL